MCEGVEKRAVISLKNKKTAQNLFWVGLLRHAGMCPAAAAELEYEYRPGHCSAVSRLCLHFIWLGWRQEPRTHRLIIPTYGC